MTTNELHAIKGMLEVLMTWTERHRLGCMHHYLSLCLEEICIILSKTPSD
jgi:hypothetical protein